jgi:hypothetical protein
MMNIKITSNFDSRKFEREMKKEIGKAAEKEIKSKLSPAARRGLKVKFDGKSSVEVSGPDEFVEEAKRKLS